MPNRLHSKPAADWSYDDLAGDLTRRRREINTLFDVLDRSTEDGEKQVVSRVILLILYAHWEGFIKWSSQRYLEAVHRFVQSEPDWPRRIQGMLLLTLNESEFASSMDGNLAKRGGAVARIVDHDFKPVYKMRGLRKSDDNVGTNFLKRIYEIFDLSYSYTSLQETFVDRDLVRVRNGAAHGEYVPVTHLEAITARDMVFSLLSRFSETLFEAYVTKRFLRPEVP